MSAIKIAYVLVCYDAATSGVYKKVLDQVTSWKESGQKVQLFVITDKRSLATWQEIDPFVVALFDSGIVKKVVNRVRILKLAAKSSPSIIYFRDSFPIWLRRSSVPIVLEIQSLVAQELKLRSKYRYLVFKLLAQKIYSPASGAIYVTNELRELNEFQLDPKVPKISIGNGINFDRVIPLPARPAIKPALFFVGSPNQLWHGVFELIEFAELNPDIDIEVVGNSVNCSTPNIRFHGILGDDEYRSIAARCIAGVGTLNLSVKNMSEDSSLKVREYLALGLPVIVKYKDVDLDSPKEFVLQIPNDGRRLGDFSMEIRTFLNAWASKRVSSTEISNLDVVVKEKLRLSFFDHVISQQFEKNL